MVPWIVGGNPPRYVVLEPPVAFRGVQMVFAAAAIIACRLGRSILPSVDTAKLREKNSVRAKKRAARHRVYIYIRLIF
jgi:hypothetical protein